MKKIILVVMLAFTIMLSNVFAAASLNCGFSNTGICNTGEVAIFYANGAFVDGSGKILSSNVAISSDANYDRPLCCSSPYGPLSVRYIDTSNNCDAGEVDLMFFTDSTNARVAFDNYDSSTSFNFDINNYNKKMCIKLPVGFGSAKLIASDIDYSMLGYTCMYKITGMENGIVSSCDATFNGANQYGYSVWGQLFENTNTLNCNADCVSVLTNRVAYECKNVLDECLGVPIECNGALLGSWINYNSTHEVLCEREWNQYRSKVFTSEDLDVSSTSGDCENIVSKKYSVIVDNEVVNLRVFVCDN